MHAPNITFSIDPEKDIGTFFAFANETYDMEQALAWAFWKPFPESKAWFSENRFIGDRKTVETFVREYYVKNGKAIKRNMDVVENMWRKKEKRFSELTEQLFPDAVWPKGTYECFSTIWGMYPRFLDDCSFQIPWNHPKPGYAIAVIPHEMLHFIWYTEFYKHHPEFTPGTEDDYFVWHVSELFNSIVQGLPHWVKVCEQEPMTYPQHETILTQLKLIYRTKKNWAAEDLTNELIEHVKEAGLAKN